MSVKVAVRVRPFNKRELELKTELCVSMSGDTTSLIVPKGVTSNSKSEFTYDNSFWSFDQFEAKEDGYLQPTGQKYADQKKVFETLGKPLLDNAWEGYHCCLFAYGQTGSGKSYSMIGYGANRGIVPIACEQMFNRLTGKKAGEDYEVTVSMIEIYNEKINDLLSDIKKRPEGGLQIRENKILGIYVQGAKKEFVSDYSSIEALMDQGSKNRTIAATQMNATSSRAHTVIAITFTQNQVVAGKKTSKISVINLVDLAGSERQGKTGATGDRLKEAAGINLSLTTLGQVISALADKADKKDIFVPYRNSALTRILQNALGGNSKTCMICALSPAADNFEETLSTLRYADQAKKIKNVPVVNETETDKIIKGLKDQNERLKALLAEKDRMLLGIGQPHPQTEPVRPSQPVQQQVPHQPQPEKKPQSNPNQDQQLKNQQGQSNQPDQPDQPKQHETKLEDSPQLAQEKPRQIQHKESHDPANINQGLAMGLQNMFNFNALNGMAMNSQQQSKDESKMSAQQMVQEQKFIEQMIRHLTMDTPSKIQGQQNRLSNLDNVSNQILQNIQHNNDQGALYMSQFALNNLFGQQQQNRNSYKQMIPPFLENISKDIMTNRKIKIFLAKRSITVGKPNFNPPCDIVISGRDVEPIHAEFTVEEGRVFLVPYNFKCLVYRNGQPVKSKIELRHLDRLVFGWNSLYLFKMVDDKNFNERIKDREIDWDFYREQLKGEQDIDQSDTQNGGDSCCVLM